MVWIILGMNKCYEGNICLSISRRLGWQGLDGLGRTLLVRLGWCCATRGGWCEVHWCCAASRIAASLEQSSVYWLVQELACCAWRYLLLWSHAAHRIGSARCSLRVSPVASDQPPQPYKPIIGKDDDRKHAGACGWDGFIDVDRLYRGLRQVWVYRRYTSECCLA